MQSDRFWSKVAVKTNDECWIWLSVTDKDGYGLYFETVERNTPQRRIRAHRRAYELVNGVIPNGLLILHSCHIRNCVNPNHLRTGTPAENSADCVEAGRSTRGSANSRAKLTEDQIKELRTNWVKGKHGQTAYWSQHFGVSKGTIQAIVYRKRWQHVT